MSKYEVEIPEGHKLYVAVEYDSDGVWAPRAVPIIAKNKEEARQKLINDEINDDDLDPEEELIYREDREREAGRTWEVLELYVDGPPVS